MNLLDKISAESYEIQREPFFGTMRTGKHLKFLNGGQVKGPANPTSFKHFLKFKETICRFSKALLIGLDCVIQMAFFSLILLRVVLSSSFTIVAEPEFVVPGGLVPLSGGPSPCSSLAILVLLAGI